MEMWIIDALVVGACAFLGSIAYPIVHNWGLDSRLVGMDRRLSAIEGSTGKSRQIAGQEREQMALMEVMGAIQAGKPPQEAIKEVGAKYPDVLMKYLKGGLRP